jgi:hypothetical protein
VLEQQGGRNGHTQAEIRCTAKRQESGDGSTSQTDHLTFVESNQNGARQERGAGGQTEAQEPGIGAAKLISTCGLFL